MNMVDDHMEKRGQYLAKIYWWNNVDLQSRGLAKQLPKIIQKISLISIGGIKHNQIHHYLIDWFEKIHLFLNMLVIHSTPFGAHWCKKKFLEKWLVSNGGFPIFDTPNRRLVGFIFLIWQPDNGVLVVISICFLS
jgi:hypothetical protein